MASIITDAGAQYMLGVLFGATAKPTTFTLQLLTVVAALADTDTNTTHTVATGGGYADVTLSNNATATSVGGIPVAQWPVQEWTFSGPLTTNPNIVGYQILQGTTVLGIEVMTTPVIPSVSGDKFRLTPQLFLGNGTPT